VTAVFGKSIAMREAGGARGKRADNGVTLRVKKSCRYREILHGWRELNQITRNRRRESVTPGI
jgi:hypothetical protein